MIKNEYREMDLYQMVGILFYSLEKRRKIENTLLLYFFV